MLGVAVALSFALALSSCSVLLGGGNNTDEYCPEGTQEYCPEGTHEYEWVIISEATCYAPGYREYVCKNCPMAGGREEIPMTEHDMILVDSKASTCSEEGYKKWSCKNCYSADKEETIPKAEHDLVAVNGKAPTCEEDGFSDYQRCKWCSYSTYEVIKATGHTLGAWVENTPVGCTYAGTEKAECTAVGCDYYEMRDVLALGHDEVPHIGKDATCTEDGWTEYVSCTRCDYNTKVVIPAGHKFVNGVCSACGTTKYLKFTLSDDETYYTVTGIGDYTDENEIVVIPELYCGLPVKKIGSRAFANCENIVSITVPDSVEYIDYGAFYGCSALAELTVPFVGASDDAVGYRIHFGYVFGCATYYAPINNYHYRSANPYMDGEMVEGLPLEDGYYYFRYYIPSSLKRVTVTDTEAIDAFTLRNCGFIESIIIDDTVTSVGSEAFFGCTALTSVYYMGTEESWGGISVGSDNEPLTDAARYYYSEQEPGKEGDFWHYGENGDIVFWPEHIHNLVFGETVTEEGCYTNGEALWKCESEKCGYTEPKVIPAAHSLNEDGVCTVCGALAASEGIEYTLSINRDYYIVTGYGSCTDTTVVIADMYNGLPVKEIGEGSLSGNKNLVGVILPKKLERISVGAFSGCSALKSIVIPDSVKTIEVAAFTGCSSLESMTLPFTGYSSTPEVIGEIYPFGYIFGEISYEGSTSVKQYIKDLSTGKSREISFYIPSGLKKVKITGETVADYAFYNCKNITEITLGEKVTEIGSHAFFGCEGITGITIPDSITSIKTYAFDECTNLAGVYINDIAKWFEINFNGSDANPLYCAKNLYVGGELLTELVIPEGITELNSVSFTGCTSIISVTVGNDVTSIGSSAFARCDNLTSVTIGDSVTEIGEGSFSNCASLAKITIGKGVTNVGDNAFHNCNALDGVYISDIAAWCEIEFEGTWENPLYYAKKLYVDGELVTDLVIPDGVENIKWGAFVNCQSITSVTIPNSVTIIDAYAFHSCIALKVLKIGSGVNTIGGSAFGDCTGLSGVYISDIAAWCEIYFGEIDSNPLYYAKKLYFDGTLVTDLVIPNNVTRINFCSFVNCASIISVTVGNDVTSIGSYAFAYCDNLTSVTIGDSVTKIGERSFSGCASLAKITIGKGVTCVGIYTFENCLALDGVYINDIAAWCRIAFLDYCSNPLFYANKLYVGGKLVKSLVIPASVTSIQKYAFFNCTSITSVTFSNSIKSIDQQAFWQCLSLETVYYKGTAEQWALVSLGPNNGLDSLTVQYS